MQQGLNTDCSLSSAATWPLRKRLAKFSPLAVYFHTSYDETPARVRIAWKAGEQAQSQTGKIYTVQTSWAMLLKMSRDISTQDFDNPESKQLLIIRGAYSPAMAASDATTGEAVATILQHVHKFPDDIHNTFASSTRIAETDGALSNGTGRTSSGCC